MNTSHHKEFEKIIRRLSHRYQAWQVFADFCEMAAISLSNAMIKNEAREARYLEIVKRYTKDEVNALASLLGVAALALEGLHCDFLGEVFMGLDLGSHWHGQYFTPFCICRMMAAMTAGDPQEKIADKGFISVMEPCVGAGAMVIAVARTLLDEKINYQKAMHVTAIDISATAAHMAYIQFSLLHIPAVVYVGNTLSMEMHDVFYTPAHFMGLWDSKLMRQAREEADKQNIEAIYAAAPSTPPPCDEPRPEALAPMRLPVEFPKQLALF